MLFRVHPKYEMIGKFDIADITFVYRIIVWHHSKYQKPLQKKLRHLSHSIPVPNYKIWRKSEKLMKDARI